MHLKPSVGNRVIGRIGIWTSDDAMSSLWTRQKALNCSGATKTTSGGTCNGQTQNVVSLLVSRYDVPSSGGVRCLVRKVRARFSSIRVATLTVETAVAFETSIPVVAELLVKIRVTLLEGIFEGVALRVTLRVGLRVTLRVGLRVILRVGLRVALLVAADREAADGEAADGEAAG
jgi:hypothetical protein